MGVDPLSEGSRQRRAVFLDRDGVINETMEGPSGGPPPTTLAQLKILPGVPAALQRLRDAGFRLIVVTNQPDVARGKTSLAAVEGINRELMAALPLDAIEVCYHDDADACDCRKPAPGLLLRAASRDGIDLAGSFMVGDRWRDIEAGKRAGCRTVLVYNAKAEPIPTEPWQKADSLAEAADLILKAVMEEAQ